MRSKRFLKIKLGLLLTDSILLIGIFPAVYSFRLDSPGTLLFSAVGFWFAVAMALMSLYVFGAYQVGRDQNRWQPFLKVLSAVLASAVLVLAVHYIFAKDRGGFFGRGIFLGGTVVFVVFASAIRMGVASYLKKLFENKEWFFVLNEKFRDLVESEIKKRKVLGKVQFIEPSKILQNPEVYLNKEKNIVIGTRNLSHFPGLSDKLVQARFSGQLIADLVFFYEQTWRKIPYFYIDEEWLVSSEGFGIVVDKASLRVKRLGDLFGALMLLLLAWPFMVLTALAVRLESKGASLYKQVRTGLSGDTFEIYKFRSMRVDAEKDGAQWAQKNDTRITRVGSFIRKTRLDELPQIFNILKGDMSFVGPRPERPEFNQILEKEIPFYNLRHLVPPGLTGWAQINYPYGASVDDAKEKLSYELYYIKNHSLLMDLKIILQTIRIVILGKGT